MPPLPATAAPHALAAAATPQGPCANCGKTSTPLWRRGPDDTQLCNACGLHYGRFGVLRDVSALRVASPGAAKKPTAAKAATKVKKAAAHLAGGRMASPSSPAPVPRRSTQTDRAVCERCRRTRLLPIAVRASSLSPTWTCGDYPIPEFSHCYVPMDHWSVHLGDSSTSSEASVPESEGASELSSAEINVDAWAPFRTYALNLARMTRDAYSGTSREHSWRFGELLFELMTLQVVPEAGAKWAPAELLYDAGFVRRVQELFGKDSREVGILQSIMNLLRQCFARAPAQRPTVDQILATVQAW